MLSHIIHTLMIFLLFFFNDTATTEIYTLSLHDALPICGRAPRQPSPPAPVASVRNVGPPGNRRAHDRRRARGHAADRKSTRLNSSHITISYAVFCLKKKKKKKKCMNSTTQIVFDNDMCG